MSEDARHIEHPCAKGQTLCAEREPKRLIDGVQLLIRLLMFRPGAICKDCFQIVREGLERLERA